jgi:hypothetical protein
MQQISDAINNGIDPSTPALKDQLKQTMAEIGLQSDQLKVQLNATEDKDQKAGIRDQRTQLQTLRDQLKLQSDQLGFSQKYGDSVEENGKGNKLLTDSLDRMVGIGKNFASANINQFEQDLGISGNGAIPTLANMGVDFLSSMLSHLFAGGLQTNIQVNSVDEALAARQNIINKQSLQYTQR